MDIEWIGWGVTNVLVAVFFIPLALLVVRFFAWLFAVPAPKIGLFSAYRDGQLGYVIVGWMAAAFFELLTAARKPHGWQDWMGWDFGAIVLFGLLGSVVGVGGGMFPAKAFTPVAGQPVKNFFRKVLNFRVFSVSVILAALCLWLVVSIHKRTTTHC
ncbi:hypothetical protein [Paraburkholderia sp. BL17N1]|uniref:hypothetical protein n=1 Tax=Paraburkholderia sp. BL17N1 TaxID=1938798 RepID=UPI000EAFAE01|nr:hypothetical protein [Paraburkholderia sp. BL17N1]RKR45925.1 hypothetical protein B0G82_3590 [Paraburkholderia sp. BL17N1]